MGRQEIIYEHGADEQIAALGIGFQRFDSLMEAIEWVLCNYAEMFPTLPGTKLSLCKTNEFVGGEFSDVPSLALFFYYDDTSIRIVAVELNGADSYGL